MSTRLLSHGFAFVLLVAASGAQESPASKDTKPAAPQRIAGLAGFVSASEIVYAEAPDRPHELIATYVFPDRARWWLALKEDPEQRTLCFRRGQLCHMVDAGKSSSRRLEGGDRDELMRRLELRRAVFLWPDGFEWSGDGRERTAKLGPLGSLRVELDESGRPTSATSFDAAEHELERFETITWREQRGRTWPASFNFGFEGKTLWAERVESVEPAVSFLDEFFVPADRRTGPNADGTVNLGGAPGEVQDVDLPPVTIRRIPLPRGLDWSGAVLDIKRAISEARGSLEPQGLSIDGRFAFEITPQGAPSAILLRLSQRSAQPPEGWENVPERTAVSVIVNGPPPVDESVLRALLERVPGDAKPGQAYIRFSPPESKARRLQVVIPLQPPE